MCDIASMPPFGKQTQFATQDGQAGSRLEPIVRNKANSPGYAGRDEAPGMWPKADHAKQTQLPEAKHRGGVGRRGRREHPLFQHSSPRARDTGQSCQTNPIWPGRPARDAGGRQAPPGHDGAKQSQFLPELREGQVACRKGVMAHRICNRLRQNKANLPGRPPRGVGRASHERSRPCGVLRQTNPIPRLPIADSERSGARRQSLPGRLYKQTQFAPAGRNRSGKPEPETRFIAFGSPIHPACGSMAPNKANFPRTNGRGKCLAGKELWYSVPAIGFGKTKPNLGEPGHLGKGGPRIWGDVAGKWNAQNEAK